MNNDAVLDKVVCCAGNRYTRLLPILSSVGGNLLETEREDYDEKYLVSAFGRAIIFFAIL